MKRSLLKCFFLFALFTSFSFLLVTAEGSKELMPDISSRAALSTVDGTFAAYNSSAIGNEKKRLNIHISNPSTEIVYMGFSLGYNTGISDILGEGSTSTPVYYFRILDPAGNIVYGPQAINASNAIPIGTPGYNQVKAGPAAIVGAAGYTGFSFTPAAGAVAGDYYIEFNKDATTFLPNQCSFDYWDITVAKSGASPVALPGRIWGNQIGFYSKDYTSGSYSGVFKGNIYSYTTEGFVNKVDFMNSDFRGGSFLIGMNSTGPGTSGNVLADRRSIYNIRTVGNEYKLFLNNPDIIAYPSGDATPPLLNISNLFIACGATSIPIDFTLNRPGKIEILLDFNNNGIYDAGTRDVVLAANGTTGTNTITWDLKDGLGNTVNEQDLNAVNIKIKYELGVHHISLSDIEFLSNGFTVQAVRPIITPGFVTKFYWDDTNIYAGVGNNVPYTTGPQPNVVELAGAPVRKWNNFTDNATPGFGNYNSINTWWNSEVSTQSYKFNVQSCGTTPVKLTSFKALLETNNVVLKWATENEINLSHFAIEKSIDGSTYKQIGNVSASANNGGNANYTFYDADINNAGIIFYRLRSIDLDGKNELSDVRTVRIDNTSAPASILAFPNPVIDLLYITIADNLQGKKVSYIIRNNIGQTVILVEKASALKTEKINTNVLQSGLYILSISCNGVIINQKIIKK